MLRSSWGAGTAGGLRISCYGACASFTSCCVLVTTDAAAACCLLLWFLLIGCCTGMRCTSCFRGLLLLLRAGRWW